GAKHLRGGVFVRLWSDVACVRSAMATRLSAGGGLRHAVPRGSRTTHSVGRLISARCGRFSTTGGRCDYPAVSADWHVASPGFALADLPGGQTTICPAAVYLCGVPCLVVCAVFVAVSNTVLYCDGARHLDWHHDHHVDRA